MDVCRNYLTDAQVREIICENRMLNKIPHYANDIESGFEIPTQVGQGFWKQIILRPGLRLGVLDVIKRQTHLHTLKPNPATQLTSLFYLSGRSQLFQNSSRKQWINQANHSYATYLPETTGLEEYQPGERIQIVQISVDINLFRELCVGQTERLPSDFRSITDQTQHPFFFQFGQFTPAMRLTLQQILDCPYAGFIKRLYLESKALELLSLQFQQAVDQVESGSQPVHISGADVERIYAAREILDDRLINPPSLLELAHLVGLNDFKLKRGFKQVYSTTVFSYVCEQRMKWAQTLLQEHQMNVEEIARTVGYANRSSFAAAFRRKFGINPKSYQN
jgi:AraC family transcriptional regulator, transcriptional activator of the genes for pyochelin and ferripyochelin receptors